jgi:hypothetical protein
MRLAFMVAALFSSQIFALENGTLLFIENGQNLVESCTHSSFSHVAIVIDDYVYEADLPQIKKQTVLEWLTNVGKHNEGKGSPALLVVLAPNKPYLELEVSKMREFLEGQVGRRYSVRGYFKKVPGDGIHCAEMCACALESSGKFKFLNAHCTLSPQNLYDCVPYHQSGSKLYVRVKHRRPIASRWCDWLGKKGTMCSWSCLELFCF